MTMPRCELAALTRKSVSAAAAALMAVLAPMPAWSGPACGPGPHWVDSCPATPANDLDVFTNTTGVHTIELFGLGVFTLTMSGPTTVWRGPGMTTPDHHIETEMVSLQLTGGGLTLVAGDGIANGLNDGPLHSPGRITEQLANPALADSFFDVFFAITGSPLGALGPLHNVVACRMESEIDRVPPRGASYLGCGTDPVLLVTQSGQVVGRLFNATHRIPEPSTLALLALAMCAAVGLCRRAGQ